MGGHGPGPRYSVLIFFMALRSHPPPWHPPVLTTMILVPYKESGTYILRAADEISQQLDDHIVMTQAMSFSPFKKPFESRILSWENKLRTTQDVVEEWLVVQKNWL